MMEVASTKTFTPSKSNVLSIIPAPFSNDIEYENPEQPPPTTPTRSPAGTGFCCAMISFTLVIAVPVRLSGLGSTAGVVVVGAVGAVVVVAILLSSENQLIITNRVGA